jgi:hypothetical protein
LVADTLHKDKKIEDKEEYMNNLFDELRRKNVMIAKALGPSVKLKPLKVTTMRCKLIPRCYGQHFLIIGEAGNETETDVCIDLFCL